MDFEKEAREIAFGKACGDCDGIEGAACEEAGGCVYLADEITDALRKAYLSGQEEAARLFDKYEADCRSLLFREKSSVEVAEDLQLRADEFRSFARRIRSLPLQSNDEKELG